MKYQESLGKELGKDFRPCEEIVIKYELEGVKRTYHPDFLFTDENIICEIKQNYALKFHNNPEKFAAAEKFCKETGKVFKVYTELDFPKISFDKAKEDKDIIWDERTFAYFK